MLRVAGSQALRLCRPQAAPAVAQRWLAIEGMQVYKDKESAEENLFFKREEEKVLKNLLKKVRANQSPEAAKQAEDAERSALDKIVGKYKMKEEDVKALLEWKLEHH